MMILRRILSMRVFVCVLGLVGVGGCVRASGSGTGLPGEVRANLSDFLTDLAREALAAFLL
ncbi:MAG: hypothetical protein A49_16180 [Methyloceanibacter sp.]|nr:MAG: hypothetical protein A49_16180 [Methyloceanibacter sp.]